MDLLTVCQRSVSESARPLQEHARRGLRTYRRELRQEEGVLILVRPVKIGHKLHSAFTGCDEVND